MRKILLYIVVSASLLITGCQNNHVDIDSGTGDIDSGAKVEQLINTETINEYIPLGYTYIGKKDIYKIYFDNTYWRLDNQSQFAPSDFVFYNQDETLSAIVYTDNNDSPFETYIRQELDKYNKLGSGYTILSSGSGSVDSHQYIDITFEITQEDSQLTNRLLILKLDNAYLNILFVADSKSYQGLMSAINGLIKGVSLK